MTNKLLSVGIYILIVEMMERLTYYTFSGSQRNNLEQQFGYSTAQAVSIHAVFGVLSYVTVFIGGFLADAYLGRYKTIVVFVSCYCIGVTMCSIASHPNIVNADLYLVGIMFFMALGAGGMKPNISNFGGDQYDPLIPKEKIAQEKFFNYFYMMINVGAAVAFGCLTTVATGGSASLPGQAGNNSIPKEYGYFAAYMIAAGCMFVALIIFLIGTPKYHKVTPSGNSMGGAISFLGRGAATSTRGKIAVAGWILIFTFLLITIINAFLKAKKIVAFAYVNLALTVAAVVCLCVGHFNNDWIASQVDNANGWLRADEATALFSAVPIILCTDIFFMFTYQLMDSYIPVQTCHMNLNVGGGQLNGTFMTLTNCAAIVIATPLLNELWWPFLGRMMGRTVNRRIKLVFGFGFAACAMIFAAAMEYVRRGADFLPALPENISNCAGSEEDPVYMSNISAFIMFIPFALVGMAEICINPTLLHFAFSQCPPRTRSLAQAFNLFCSGGVSNAIVSTVTLFMADFLPDNLNHGGHIEYFYFVALGNIAIGLPIVLYLDMNFVDKTYDDDHWEEPIEDKAGDDTVQTINSNAISGMVDGKKDTTS
eukprot:comp23412_c0_seq2/m.38907 comp23412_c0_seq2/g.38907  ORF comp23412_c0_seq2/g.38907 comp23412_c0_seq2/m.38907 type:complete len:596 (-) comp23412_c0_seq2:286-2073(-)